MKYGYRYANLYPLCCIFDSQTCGCKNIDFILNFICIAIDFGVRLSRVTMDTSHPPSIPSVIMIT